MPPTAAFTSLNALQRERYGGQRSLVGHVSNFQVLANGCDFVKGLYMTRRTYRRAAAEAAVEVAKQEGLTDFRTVINSGEAAGQTVFHVHVHVIGGRSLAWPPG